MCVHRRSFRIGLQHKYSRAQLSQSSFFTFSSMCREGDILYIVVRNTLMSYLKPLGTYRTLWLSLCVGRRCTLCISCRLCYALRPFPSLFCRCSVITSLSPVHGSGRRLSSCGFFAATRTADVPSAEASASVSFYWFLRHLFVWTLTLTFIQLVYLVFEMTARRVFSGNSQNKLDSSIHSSGLFVLVARKLVDCHPLSATLFC